MGDGKELAIREVPELKPIPVDKIVEYTEHVKKIAKTVMKEKHHYGVIPGTDKPTLLKPGAEILCVAFRLNPQYEILTATERDDLILYNVRCVLIGIDSGKVIASGIGSCNSKEKKYRYIADTELTGKPVPKDYWKERDQSLIGGPGHFTKKIDGEWVIVKKGDAVERKDAWDIVNTILKMAEKRALIAAVLNATAASDVFTQDLEDAHEDIIDVEAEVIDEPTPVGETEYTIKDPDAPATGKQAGTIWGLIAEVYSRENKEEHFADLLTAKYDGREVVIIDGKTDITKTLTKGEASELITYLESKKGE